MADDVKQDLTDIGQYASTHARVKLDSRSVVPVKPATICVLLLDRQIEAIPCSPEHYRDVSDTEDGDDLTTSVEIELGERIRGLRSERKFSLRDLAERSGLTASFISQVERGRAIPSIASLGRLGTVLGVPVGRFFEPAPATGQLVRRDERRTIVLRGLGEIDEYVTADPAGKLQVAITTFEVGGRSAEVSFVHESDEECVLVLEGRLEVVVGGDRYVLEPGDAVTYSPQTPHVARNIGSSPARTIFVITPPSF